MSRVTSLFRLLSLAAILLAALQFALQPAQAGSRNHGGVYSGPHGPKGFNVRGGGRHEFRRHDGRRFDDRGGRNGFDRNRGGKHFGQHDFGRSQFKGRNGRDDRRFHRDDRRYSSPLVGGHVRHGSGVLLSSGRRTDDRGHHGRHDRRHDWRKGHGGSGYGHDIGPGYWKAGRHDGRRDGRHGHGGSRILHVDRGHSTSIIVGVTAGAMLSDQAATAGGDVMLENDCAPGEYCTLRTGPYANSPKIITLNRSGGTVTRELRHIDKPEDPEMKLRESTK